MNDSSGFILIYGTYPSMDIATEIGSALVEQQLAACVNIWPGLVSIYVWEGRLQRDGEVAMIIKTRAALAETVMSEVTRRHPYRNPALVSVTVADGQADFLSWIEAQTAAGASRHGERG